jgi:arginine deiminase
MTELGVHSEVGKLRTVMVCRPGLAHQRLTPGNCHDLLFDDVIWVQEARRIIRLREDAERGVEVLDLTTFRPRRSAGARAVLDRRIAPTGGAFAADSVPG